MIVELSLCYAAQCEPDECHMHSVQHLFTNRYLPVPMPEMLIELISKIFIQLIVIYSFFIKNY